MLMPQISSSDSPALVQLPLMASVDRRDFCVRFSSDALSLADKHLKYPSTPERDHRPARFPTQRELEYSFWEAKHDAESLFQMAWDTDAVPEDFFTDSSKPITRRVQRLFDNFFHRNLCTRPPCIKVVQKAQAAGSSESPNFGTLGQ